MNEMVCSGKQPQRGGNMCSCIHSPRGGGFILSQPSAGSAPVLSTEIGKKIAWAKKHFTVQRSVPPAAWRAAFISAAHYTALPWLWSQV